MANFTHEIEYFSADFAILVYSKVVTVETKQPVKSEVSQSAVSVLSKRNDIPSLA